MDVPTIAGLLQAQTSSTNTKAARETTSALKKIYKNPAAFPLLLQIAVTGEYDRSVRKLAAIEARKLIDARWVNLSADERVALRQTMFQSVLQEQDEVMQHSLAYLIPEIAAVDSQWTDLPSSLMDAINSPQYCNCALFIVHSMLQASPALLEDRYEQVATVLETIISNPASHEPYVRNAIIAFGTLVEILDGDSNPNLSTILERNVPAVLEYLNKFIQAGNADAVEEVFSVCQALLTNDSAILKSTFPHLMNKMIEFAAQADIDEPFRCHALDCLTNAVQYYRSKLQSLGLAENIAKLAVSILVELGEDYDGEDEDDESVGHYGYGLLELLLSSYPAQVVVKPILPIIGEFLTSGDEVKQQAGAVALKVCVTCAPDFISSKLRESIPLLQSLLSSSKINVRKSILTCLISIGEVLGEDLSGPLAQVVEPIMFVLKDACHNVSQDNLVQDNTTVIKYALSALSHIIPNLEKEVANRFATELMEILVSLVQNATFSEVHASAIGALGSIAVAVGDGFVNVLDQVMTFLGPPLEAGLAEQDSDRVNDIYEAVGKIAQAVGSQHFSKYVDPLISSSLKALESSEDNLFNDTIYVLWSLLADVYDESISTYLPRMMTALNSCIQKNGTVDKLGNLLKTIDDADGDDSDSDDMTFDGAHLMSDSSIELGTAIDVVGDLMLASKKAFIPYFEDTVRTMLGLMTHPVEYVRQKAISTLWRSFQTLSLIEVSEGNLPKWLPGNPPPPKVPDLIIQLGQEVFKATLSLWKDEIDSDVVEEIHTTLAETLRTCGPTILMSSPGTTVLDGIVEQLRLILSKQHMCQDVDEDEKADVKAAIHTETSEYEWTVIDTAFDVICALACALGSHFAPTYASLSELIYEYARCESAQERSTAIGTIAECFKFVGESLKGYTSQTIEILPANFGGEDHQAISNATYCAGILCEKVGSELPDNFVSSVLSSISPILNRGGNDRVTDNAVGCLARIMSRFPEKIPFDESLNKLVSLLPLLEDYEENAVVYSLICKLYDERNPTMLSLTPQMRPILKEVLDSPKSEVVDDETRAKLQSLANLL